MNKVKFRFLGFLVLLLLLVVTACGKENNSREDSTNGQEGKAQIGGDDWPDKIVFGIVPSEDEGEVSRHYEQFRQYLEEKLGRKVEVFVGSDYTAVIEAMKNGHIQIGGFGPFSYVLAKQRANAEAFAMGVMEPGVVRTYTASFITLNDSGVNSLKDLEGRRMAWSSPASASGHLIPKSHLIKELGLTPDNVDDFFSNVTFSGAHDSSVISVLNGDVDAAPVPSSRLDAYLETFKDHPNADKLIVFADSDPIPGAASAVHGDLPESLKEAIKEAFIDAINHPELKEGLEQQHFPGGYAEVEDSLYDVLRNTVTVLGMDPEELIDQ